MTSVRKIVIRWTIILSAAFAVWAFVLPGGLPLQLRVWKLQKALAPVRAEFPQVNLRFLPNGRPESVRYNGSVRGEAEKAQLIAHLKAYFSREEAESLCSSIEVAPVTPPPH